MARCIACATTRLPGRHDDAVGRRQARAYRGSKRHQREYPGVEKQETLNAGGDNGGLADGVRRRGDDGECGDKQAQRCADDNKGRTAAPPDICIVYRHEMPPTH
jgi:hypothetical protein